MIWYWNENNGNNRCLRVTEIRQSQAVHENDRAPARVGWTVRWCRFNTKFVLTWNLVFESLKFQITTTKFQRGKVRILKMVSCIRLPLLSTSLFRRQSNCINSCARGWIYVTLPPCTTGWSAGSMSRENTRKVIPGSTKSWKISTHTAMTKVLRW